MIYPPYRRKYYTEAKGILVHLAQKKNTHTHIYIASNANNAQYRREVGNIHLFVVIMTHGLLFFFGCMNTFGSVGIGRFLMGAGAGAGEAGGRLAEDALDGKLTVPDGRLAVRIGREPGVCWALVGDLAAGREADCGRVEDLGGAIAPEFLLLDISLLLGVLFGTARLGAAAAGGGCLCSSTSHCGTFLICEAPVLLSRCVGTASALFRLLLKKPVFFGS